MCWVQTPLELRLTQRLKNKPLLLKSLLCWNNWGHLRWRKRTEVMVCPVMAWLYYYFFFVCLDSLMSWSGSCFLLLIPANITGKDLRAEPCSSQVLHNHLPLRLPSQLSREICIFFKKKSHLRKRRMHLFLVECCPAFLDQNATLIFFYFLAFFFSSF